MPHSNHAIHLQYRRVPLNQIRAAKPTALPLLVLYVVVVETSLARCRRRYVTDGQIVTPARVSAGHVVPTWTLNSSVFHCFGHYQFNLYSLSLFFNLYFLAIQLSCSLLVLLFYLSSVITSIPCKPQIMITMITNYLLHGNSSRLLRNTCQIWEMSLSALTHLQVMWLRCKTIPSRVGWSIDSCVCSTSTTQRRKKTRHLAR